jgi:hypothetical protein
LPALDAHAGGATPLFLSVAGKKFRRARTLAPALLTERADRVQGRDFTQGSSSTGGILPGWIRGDHPGKGQSSCIPWGGRKAGSQARGDSSEDVEIDRKGAKSAKDRKDRDGHQRDAERICFPDNDVPQVSLQPLARFAPLR